VTQPFDPGPAGPVVSDDHSGRWMKWALAAVVAVALAFVAVQAVGGGDDDDVAADRVGEVVGGPDQPAAEGGSESEGGETPETPPPTVAAAVDLFADATKPFEVYAGIYDGQPVKVLEILLYPDWSDIQVESQTDPGYPDEYTWRGGDGVSGPEEPVAVIVEPEEMPEHVFDLTEIDPSKIPGMVEQAKAQFPGEEVEISHIIIERFLPFDTRVLVLVYFEAGRQSGYITFTPDGGLVEVVS
jgi:hypothetical protein